MKAPVINVTMHLCPLRAAPNPANPIDPAHIHGFHGSRPDRCAQESAVVESEDGAAIHAAAVDGALEVRTTAERRRHLIRRAL
jgi:hypothetical protein